MPTQKECNDYQAEIYRSISGRVKWRVFVPGVLAFAGIVGVAGRIMWSTTTVANATEIRQVAAKEANDKAYKSLAESIEKIDAKLDKVIEKIHAREKL